MSTLRYINVFKCYYACGAIAARLSSRAKAAQASLESTMQNALSRPAGSLSAYQRSLKLCIFCVLLVSVSGTLKAQEPAQQFEALPDAPST